jgi:general secretion pathway protein L
MTPGIRDHLRTIRSFYGWWLGALSGLLTPRPAATQAWRTLLLRREHGLDAIENAEAQRSGPIVLRLSPDEVVERTIQIPKGASDVIEPVLRNQMNRIVPWPPEETRFGYTVAENASGATDQIDVRLVATTHAVLEAALAEARAIGAQPSLVDYAASDEPRVGTVLLSLAPDPRLRTARRLNAGLAVVLAICVLAGGAGAYQLWQIESERAELDAQIAELRRHIAQSGDRHAQDAQLREAATVLIERKAAEPAVVRLIDALSHAIPDNAYLMELEIRGATARMTGKSEEATALIAPIEAAPEYEDVGFAAPTTRDAEGAAESFAITARATGARQEEGDRNGEQ